MSRPGRGARAGIALLLALAAGAPGAAADDLATDDGGAAALLEQASTVAARLAALRALELFHPVDSEVLSRAALAAHLAVLVERDLTAEYRDATDRFARVFGLVGPDDSYIAQLIALYEGQIAGLYDHHEQTFYILEDTPPALQLSVMSHELVHAIQDQHWGTERLLGRGEMITDHGLAVSALLEGDAMVSMIAFAADSAEVVRGGALTDRLVETLLSGARTPPGDGVPEAMWASMVFPYIAGTQFAIARVADSGWSGLDAVYARPPESSEQILHPERYATRDAPTWISFETGLEGKPELIDILGEAFGGAALRQVLAERVAPAAVDRAMDGWDGDRVELWSVDGRDVLVWGAVWDRIEDAEGFVAVAQKLVDPWIGAPSVDAAAGLHGEARWAETTAGVAWLERWGDQTLIVLDRGGEALSAARWRTVESVVGQVWATFARSVYPALIEDAGAP